MLAIVVADEWERAEEILAPEDRREQPDLVDRALRGRGVGVLDDVDEPVAIADDPPVPARVVDLGGRDRRARRSCADAS